jgi:hypothetical protein
LKRLLGRRFLDHQGLPEHQDADRKNDRQNNSFGIHIRDPLSGDWIDSPGMERMAPEETLHPEEEARAAPCFSTAWNM